MKLVGIMPVRNEDWILGLSLRVALLWCDEVVVYLHACTDDSKRIALEVGQETGRVLIYSEPEEIWKEMRDRQEMLDAARRLNATHIAIVDADEVLSANLCKDVFWSTEHDDKRNWVQRCLQQYGDATMNLPLLNLRGGTDRYHSNGLWANRRTTVVFRDHPDISWLRWGDAFHHREPVNMPRSRTYLQACQGGVLHFWGASEDRLRAKHRLYKVVERIKYPHRPVADIEEMYSWAIRDRVPMNPGLWQFEPLPDYFFQPHRDRFGKYLRIDDPPWQDAEADRLILLHGKSFFKGLSV